MRVAASGVSALLRTTAGLLHERTVLGRRAVILANWFAEFAPPGARILDVGCGDGAIASLIATARSDVSIEGVDVLVRAKTRVPVTWYDGVHIPFDDDSFDLVMFSDVLHHVDDPGALQIEARRIARRHVLIKDHRVEGIAAAARLRFMDQIGNARFGVSLPYNYWCEAQWDAAWRTIGLYPERVVTELGLYPWPLDALFGAHLHFIALLRKGDATP